MTRLAPIALTTYKRLDHLKRTINALQRNELAKQSELFIFSDGPRAGDEAAVAAVRDYARTVSGFAAVTLVERERNDRVANNRGAKREMLQRYGRVISLEEDVVTAPGFLTFMNQALDTYESRPDVFAVCAYTPNMHLERVSSADVFLSPRYSNWGVGLWQDRFARVPDHISDYAEVSGDPAFQARVARLGDDFMPMLELELTGKIDAGDVKVMYLLARDDMRVVQPVTSLTENCGHDGSGTHCGATERFRVDLSLSRTRFVMPPDLQDDPVLIELLRHFRSDVSRSTPWDDASLNHLVQEIHAEFGRAMPMPAPQTGVAGATGLGEPLVFLLGLPRSGTTLLQRILGGNSTVHTIAEPWVMLHLCYALKEEGLQADYETGHARRALKDMFLELPGGEDSYVAAIRDMAGGLYDKMLKVSGKQRFVDKTPRYYNIIPELKRVFPAAKYVFLLRNPLAVLASVLETWFDSNPGKLLDDRFHTRDLFMGPRLMMQGISLLGDAAIVLRYEDFVADPESQLQRLCAQLEMPFEAAMLQYGEREGFRGGFGDAVGVHQHGQAVANSVAKWTSLLGRPDVAPVARAYLEFLGAELLASMGYDYPALLAELEQASGQASSATAGLLPQPVAPMHAQPAGAFPHSRLAHEWLDGLSGIEVGPSAHNPFGLNSLMVGLKQGNYQQEQLRLTGEFVPLDIEAAADDIPLPDESQDYVLSSHVIEHCPNFVRTLVEWYRLVRPGGYIFMIVPHRNAAPVDVGRELDSWQHLLDDYVGKVDENTHADVSMYGGKFGSCHYHVFDFEQTQDFMRRIFGDRLTLVAGQPVDDKIGNGFTLVYRKDKTLEGSFPWQLAEGVEIDVFSKPQELFNASSAALPAGQYKPLVVAANLVPFKNPEQRQRQDLCIASLFDLQPYNVIPLNICYPDELLTPEGWQVSTELSNSAREVLGVDDKRKPFVKELFQIAASWCERQGVEYFALTNSDIIFTPALIEECNRLMNEGYDAVAVSRNEVEAIDPVRGLIPGYLEVNGYDVFLVRVSWWRANVARFQPYIFGARAWDDAYAAVMACHGKFHVLNVDGLCFHMKHPTDWLGGPYAEFNLYMYNGVDKRYQDRYNSFINEVLRVADRKTLPQLMPGLLAKHFDLARTDYLSPAEKQALKFVHIGMVTYNRLEFTKQSIESILRFTDHPYVLTVVDNNSQDGTQEYLQELADKGVIQHLLLLEENLGVARASNLAWTLEPDASYFLKLDNDIVFEKPRWLANMVAVIDRVPEVGVIGYNFEPQSYPLRNFRGVNVRVKEIGNIGGACILIPRRTHERLGFWCEDYGLYGEEDADYGARVQLAGLLNAYMEDEYIGIHLPAGRAAVIDVVNFDARDGMEEVQHEEYRKWKDEQRRNNVLGGKFETNLRAYAARLKPLYAATSMGRVAAAGKCEVSVIICSINDAKFAKVEANYRDLLRNVAHEIIRIPDARSLCEGYNRGIDQASGDILIFSHDDIAIMAADFWQRLTGHLQELDIVGVAGTSLMSGPLWGQSGPMFIHGLVIHSMPDGEYRVNSYDFGTPKICTPGIQGIDGLFFAAKRKVVEAIRFDDETFDHFHLYDLDFTYRAHLAGFRLGVCRDLLIVHDSQGGYDEVWEKYGYLFLAKFRDQLPSIPKPDFELPHINVKTLPEAVEICRAMNQEIARAELLTPQYFAGGRHLYPSRFLQYWAWEDKTAVSEVDAEILATRMLRSWNSQPVLHLVIWVVPGEESRLADTLDTLAQQFYSNWRLSVVSLLPATDNLWQEVPQLHWRQCEADNWLQALNDVVAAIPADWVTLTQPGVRLEPHALLTVADYINARPDWRLLYTDDDCYGPDGAHFDYRFKPDFNADLMRSMPYIGDALFVERELLLQLGGYANFPAWENHALALQASFACTPAQLGHIAKVLLHFPPNRLHWQPEPVVGKHALATVLAAAGVPANVDSGLTRNTYCVSYEYPGTPLVSLLIPTRDMLEYLRPCVQSVLQKTAYSNYEIIIADNQSSEAETLAWFAQIQQQHPDKVRVIAYDQAFNFSDMCNAMAREARGEFLLLLNNDTQVLQDGWLDRLVSIGKRPDVGVVGCRLIYPDSGKIQHAGIVLGFNDVAGHVFEGTGSIKHAGYMQRALCEQEYSAVTAAVMLVRRDVYEAVGGMDASDLAVLYNDADFCLRVRQQGYKVIYTPHATLLHHAGKSLNDVRTLQDAQKLGAAIERKERERRVFWQRWRAVIASDPAWNVNLSLRGADGAVESVLAPGWDVNFHDRPRIIGVPLSGGAGEYRVISPLRALRNSGAAQVTLATSDKAFVTRVIQEYELARLAPDSILLHAPLDDEQLLALRKFAAYVPDVLRIATFDDLLSQVPEKNSFKRFGYRDVERRMRDAVSLVDRCIVSTEPLRQWLLAYGARDVRVLPNYLEMAKWGGVSSVRGAGKKPRVGWAGAQQHQGDLELIYDVVKTLANEVEWVFLGMCPDELLPYVHEFHGFESNFDAYPAKLASLNLDIALAPLEMHPFNEAKSNLRLLEYGMMGWPVICTDIYPYQTGNAPVCRLANDPALWIEAIRARISDLPSAAREGDVLRQWVLDNYLLENNLAQWGSALLR